MKWHHCLYLAFLVLMIPVTARAEEGPKKNSSFPALGMAVERNTHLRTAVEHMWTEGPITPGPSTAGIRVADFDGDGQNEILSVGEDAPIILKKAGESYRQLWHGELINCTALAAGDLDGDGRPEVCAGTSEGLVYISRGDQWRVIGRVVLPTGGDQWNKQVSGLAVSDVDGDGKREIVATRTHATFVLDGQDYSIRWTASDKGGTGLAVGDLDGDGRVELVVNGLPAHILDPVAKREKFAWAGGFGDSMALGDADGDGLLEIAYASQQYNADCVLMDGETMGVKWSVKLPTPLSLTFEDLDGQGRADLIVGFQGGEHVMSVYRGTDGARLWGLSDPGYASACSLGCGDVDGDGAKEIIFGTINRSTGPDGISIVDSRTRSYEYPMNSTYGPYNLASGDIDGDGKTEILMACVINEDLSLSAFDARSMSLLWRTDSIVNGSGGPCGLYVGQLDADPAKEILLVLGRYGNATLKVFDGTTRQLQWEGGSFSQGSPVATLIKNVDSDPVEEILIAVSDGRVYILDGASNVIQWISESVGQDKMQDISLGDIDGDGVPELAVISSENIGLYSTATWDLKRSLPIQRAGRGAISSRGFGVTGQIVLSQYDPRVYKYYIRAYDYDSPAQPVWEILLGYYGFVDSLNVLDVDGDGDQEFVAAGKNVENLYGDQGSLFIIGSQVDSNRVWIEYDRSEKWGNLKCNSLADIDGDGKIELILGGDDVCHAYRLMPSAEPCSLSCEATGEPSEGEAPLFVSFSALATAAGSCSDLPAYSWDFGDGETSSEREPGHSYTAPGTYTWTVAATLPGGESCTKSGQVVVTVPPCYIRCQGAASIASGPAPLTVSFSADSTLSYCAGTAAYSWSFGDGGTSSEQNPSHEYSGPGNYYWAVRVTADGELCSVSGAINVSEPQCRLTCNASASPTNGKAPLQVAFTSAITASHCAGIPSLEWKFGDGTTSSEQNPSHKYAAPGSYAWTFSARLGGEFCDMSGTVRAESGIPGDCDGDDTVSIGEVQKAINMFLGTMAPDCGVDCDGNGAVSIGEVQKVINAFLGLHSNC